MFKVVCISLSVLVGAVAARAGYGFDVGKVPAEHVADLAEAGLGGRQGAWMRVRGVAGGRGEGDQPGRTVEGDRRALAALRERGVRVCVILRWGSGEWPGGVRAGGGHRLPLDLREAYERGRRLGATYGDRVDVWEIENEPDIDFVAENPETYAAFQKALYLGLHAGMSGMRARTRSPSENPSAGAGEGVSWRERKRGLAPGGGFGFERAGFAPAAPRVVMAPLALPPGPYLERLWANGIAGYTDGFNYHYYGFAEDFTGVYAQFRAAVAELSGRSREHPVRKSWPVFLTEYGYGLLDADSRRTVEGRVRQWRWFAEVAKQIRSRRIEGPMAFLLNPYYEADLNEFGLTMAEPAELAAGDERRGERGAGAEPNAPLRFTPADFGAAGPQPWMARIGKKVGGVRASPALAYLWDYAEKHVYRPRDWSVRAGPASPVVVDFIAGRGLGQMKSSGGYALGSRLWPAGMPEPAEEAALDVRSGGGRLVVYNFSDVPVTGRLQLSGDAGLWNSPAGGVLTLAAGERREIAVELAAPAAGGVARGWRAVFAPEKPEVGRAVWATRMSPDADGRPEVEVRGFAFPAEAAGRNRAALAGRPLAYGEAGVRADGRWLATDGVRVEERDGVWRFHVDHLPVEALRPAAVELALPDDFVFAPGTALTLERRRAVAEAGGRGAGPAGSGAGVGAAQLKPRAGRAGDRMDVYFRTANGNLYQTWPRLTIGEEWTAYTGRADDFTMAFFGRAALPWRFAENRPVALVFFLRPSAVPAVFEVRGARIREVR